jgi:LysR family transcriptional regulator, cyn operon transcriptional activator
MDPKHLIQLSVILEKGSLSAASQHLLVAQPTLTRNMATLEMQAGAQLFRRSRFGVRSTSMGEVLAREGRALARSLQMAREQVSRYQLGLNQELRLGMGPLVSVAVGPALMTELRTQLPELSLTASVMRPQLAIDALVDGDLDMVIAPAPHQQQLPDVERHVLVDDRLGIFCGPDHPYTRRENLSVDDFQDAEWVSIGMACVFDREHAKMLLDSGVTGIHTKMVFLGDAYCLCSTLMLQSFDVVVVGAGAAGLFCAGIAGQRGLKVLLLDHSEKVAEKVRISGGGRANFTNRDIDVRQPHKHYVGENPNFCRSALSRYTPARLHRPGAETRHSLPRKAQGPAVL